MEAMPSSGSEVADKIRGSASEKFRQALTELDPDLSRWIDDFSFGEVWTRGVLNGVERHLVDIAYLASKEHYPQLQNHLRFALLAEVPASKIHETLIMLVPAKGFTAAINALREWKTAVAWAREKGMPIDLEHM